VSTPQEVEPGTAPEATIQPDPQATSPEASAQPDVQVDPDTGRSAKEWQAEHDKVQAQLRKFEERMSKHGTPDEIEQFIEQMLPVVRRPDFQQYVAGKLNTTPDEDDFRTDEEKRIDALEEDRKSERAEVQGQLAELQFTRGEAHLDEQFGEIWRDYHKPMMDQIQQLTRQGQIPNASKITPEVLTTAFLGALSRKGIDETKAVLTRIVQQWETKRVSKESDNTTSVPDQGRPGTVPQKATSFQEAWELAKQGVPPPAR
jgi:hypothetical protein